MLLALRWILTQWNRTNNFKCMREPHSGDSFSRLRVDWIWLLSPDARSLLRLSLHLIVSQSTGGGAWCNNSLLLCVKIQKKYICKKIFFRQFYRINRMLLVLIHYTDIHKMTVRSIFMRLSYGLITILLVVTAKKSPNKKVWKWLGQ